MVGYAIMYGMNGVLGFYKNKINYITAQQNVTAENANSAVSAELHVESVGKGKRPSKISLLVV